MTSIAVRDIAGFPSANVGPLRKNNFLEEIPYVLKEISNSPSVMLVLQEIGIPSELLEENFCFPQLVDDLLRSVASPDHPIPLSDPYSNIIHGPVFGEQVTPKMGSENSSFLRYF